MGTDPAVANESGADSDGDGWTDLREYKEGTDPWLKDSDFDEIKDSDDFEQQIREKQIILRIKEQID